MLFGMKCASRHGWPFYEDSKSFYEEHALCIKCSGTTGRLGPPLLFTNKIKAKSLSAQKQFGNSAYVFNIKLDLWTGCTYGEKIKQLTFFASVPFHWSCVIRWVSECEDKVITSHPYRPNAANATDCWAPLPPAHPQTDPPSVSCGPFVCSVKNTRSLPTTWLYFICISVEFPWWY